MKNKDKCCGVSAERLGKVGGQAVLEGVMMKAGDRTVTTCRKEDGTLVVVAEDFKSKRKQHKILDLPIIRGVVSFIESMALSMRTLTASADAMGIEEEDGKLERWLKKHLGVRVTDLIMGVALVLGLLLSVFLFMFLPSAVADLVNYLFEGKIGAWRAVIEGVAKIGIFLAYLALVSLMPDIKRTFMYHGAEHKSIACYEAGDELTPERAREYTRFHPRCGTSFMFFMILLGIFIGFFLRTILPGLDTLAYTGIKILSLPILMGLGFEIIRFSGKHDNIITRILSAPGLWVQRITTREPTDDMLQVAIISLKCALRDEVPEFMEFYNSAPWNKSSEGTDSSVQVEGESDSAAENEDKNGEEGVSELASESAPEIATDPMAGLDTNVAEESEAEALAEAEERAGGIAEADSAKDAPESCEENDA